VSFLSVCARNWRTATKPSETRGTDVVNLLQLRSQSDRRRALTRGSRGARIDRLFNPRTRQPLIKRDDLADEVNLRMLIDRAEIGDLVSLYAHCIAAESWLALSNLFTPDAVVDFSDLMTFARPARATTSQRSQFPNLVFHGRDAIFNFFPIAGRLGMKAFFSNHIIRVSGDDAKGVSFFENRLSQGEDSVIGAGRMIDEYTRTGGRWLIAYRRQELFYFTGLKEGWAESIDRLRTPPPPKTRGWEDEFLTTSQQWDVRRGHD
jgi:hypothetical protein